MSHNEAADALRHTLGRTVEGLLLETALTAAKAEGAREAVERIKAHIPENGKWYGLKTVWAILDEEAAR